MNLVHLQVLEEEAGHCNAQHLYKSTAVLQQKKFIGMARSVCHEKIIAKVR